jgi:anti-anti-sigma factor
MKRDHDYDLIVIGAGIAGMVSAVTAASLGKRVAVVEKSRVGGSCTNTTCIPSKALIRLGHASREMAHLERLGLLRLTGIGLEGARIMPRIRDIVRTAYEKDLPETFERIGIRMVQAQATFLDPHRIRAGGETLSAKKFIIAAGTIPLIPDIPGLAGIEFLTNETLYRLETLPRSLVILGGGVDGLEYASAFGRLGVETTVVEMAERLLPMADGELVGRLLELLRADGIRLLAGTKAVRLADRQGRAVLTVERRDGAQEEIEAERVLVAVGRKPDLEGLALEQAGVGFNVRGIVTDRRLRTSAAHIYACGDIAGPYLLASTAEAHGIVAATNACLPVKRSVDYRNNVYVVFTEPPLAWVGLTETEARAQHRRGLRAYRFPYETMRRALIDGTGAGMAKFLCDRRGRIAGAHILGETAAEVIHEAALVRALRKPLHTIQALTHAYPTYAQALVGRASQLAFLDRMAENPFVSLALHALPGYAHRIHLARERLAEAHSPAPSEFSSDALPAGQRACNLEVREAAPGVLILDVRGALDAACEEPLAKTFAERPGKPGRILLNLSGLSHMDPEGAGALVANTVRARGRDVGVAACGLTAPLRDVFRLTRLDEIVDLFESEGQALEAKDSPAGEPAFAPPYEGPLQPGWARSVERLSTGLIPAEAMDINVRGREPAGPVRGFGRLWDKRYRLLIEGDAPSPREIVSLWKAEFPDFWPAGNRFFASGGAPISPGTVAVLNLRLPGGLVVATGLMVLYVADTAFSFISIEGHVIAGWITFSCFREGDATIVQVHPLFRPGDPLMEFSFRVGAGGQEDRFWHRTLENLAARLGVRGAVEQRDTLVDGRFQWGEAGNIVLSAPVLSSFYMPFYVMKQALRR